MGNCCTKTNRKSQDSRKLTKSNKSGQRSSIKRPVVPKLNLAEVVPSPTYFEIREISHTDRHPKFQKPYKPLRNLEWNYIFESYSEKNESFLKNEINSKRGFSNNKKLLGLDNFSLSKQTTNLVSNFEDSKIGISPVVDSLQHQSFSERALVFSQSNFRESTETKAKETAAFKENILEEVYIQDSIVKENSSSILKLTSRRTKRVKNHSIKGKHIEAVKKQMSLESETSSQTCTYLERGPPSSNHSLCEMPNSINTETSEIITEKLNSASHRSGRSGIRLVPLKGPNLPSITEDETQFQQRKIQNRYGKGNLLNLLKTPKISC